MHHTVYPLRLQTQLIKNQSQDFSLLKNCKRQKYAEKGRTKINVSSKKRGLTTKILLLPTPEGSQKLCLKVVCKSLQKSPQGKVRTAKVPTGESTNSVPQGKEKSSFLSRSLQIFQPSVPTERPVHPFHACWLQNRRLRKFISSRLSPLIDLYWMVVG